MNEAVSIRTVARLDTYVTQKNWEWAEANSEAISIYWRDALAKNPSMFNGRVLMIGSYAEHDDCAEAAYFETDFSAFLTWIKGGFPDRSVANGFALAALRCRDGAYICGVMSDDTANAGKIYFPGGTPDPSDIRENGTVDFAASALRELKEETGLTPEEVKVSDRWDVVRHWPLVAYLRPMEIPLDSRQALEKLYGNLKQQKAPELAGYHVVRNAGDIDTKRMPEFLQAYFHHVFS